MDICYLRRCKWRTRRAGWGWKPSAQGWTRVHACVRARMCACVEEAPELCAEGLARQLLLKQCVGGGRWGQRGDMMRPPSHIIPPTQESLVELFPIFCLLFCVLWRKGQAWGLSQAWGGAQAFSPPTPAYTALAPLLEGKVGREAWRTFMTRMRRERRTDRPRASSAMQRLGHPHSASHSVLLFKILFI